MQAIASFEQSRELVVRDRNPEKWAYFQCRIGSVFGNHAKFSDAEIAKGDVQQAIKCFKDGLEAYKMVNDASGIASCEKNIAKLLEFEFG